MHKIHFFTEQSTFKLDRPEAWRSWLSGWVNTQGYQIQALNIIFCSDQMLLEINKRYLNHDYFTDIITFDLSEKSDQAKRLEGELYISIDRIRAHSARYQVTLHQELARVVAHGCAHLMGYRDKTPVEQEKMRLMEENALQYGESPF